jgi:hypothetical protein
MGTIVDLGYSFAVQGVATSSSESTVNMRSVGGWVSKLSDGGIQFIGAYGLGGQTAEQIYNSYLPQVLSLSPLPTFCNLFSGGVELLSDQSDSSVQTAIRDTKKIVDLLSAKGIIVIVNTVWVGASVISNDLRGALNDFNAWVVELARKNVGVICSNYAGVIIDPDSATAAEISGMLQSDDTHPADLGAQRIAEALHTSNLSNINIGKELLIGNLDDTFGNYGNISPNSTLTGTGGTLSGTTGTAADGFILSASSCTCVGAKVAADAADVCTADWQQMTVTAGGNSGSAAMFVTISSGFTVGETMRMMVEMEGVNFSDVLSIYCQLTIKDSGASTLLTVSDGLGVDGGCDDFSGTLASLEFEVPALANTMDFTFGVIFTATAGGSGTATLKFRRNTIARVRADDVSIPQPLSNRTLIGSLIG